jgi:peroxiredoxin
MRYLCRWSVVLAVLAVGPASSAETPGIGKTIANFQLHDYLGAPHSLADFAGSKLVVVAFLGADCPLANRYADKLVEMAGQYGPRGVAFLAIDSNEQDSLAQLAHLARVHKMEFPLLKDPGNAIADQFGALRTPEVFVLDGGRVVRYRGRVDDQYGIGFARPAPKECDLAAALDELLAGKSVSHPVREASGCLIGRVQRQPAHGDVTYANQIARLLQRHCVRCHRAGSIAPFALTSYEEAAGWAETIREVVHDRRMPPWDANPQFGVFSNDPSLTAEEKLLLDKWVENGLPKGDSKMLPPPLPFAEGWRIPKPDLVLSMPEPFTIPAKGAVRYQYFTVDPGFQEDKWIQASEVRPGNPSVVHHMVVIIQPPGTPSPALRGGIGEPAALGVPGMWPLIFPEGTARLVPAGSKLVFQMHYTPNGRVQTDQTRVGFVFADPKKVRKAIRADMAINFKLNIPAGAADDSARADYRFGQDTILYSLFPHMHLRGKSFRFTAHYPDGKEEILLDVPRYRFDWQNQYVLAKPKLMPEGTVLKCEGHFDNSEDNLNNPDPTVSVRFGEQTWNEMLVGYFDMALADQDLRAGLPRIQPLPDGRYEVCFHYQAPPGTKAVFLAGEFNHWSTNARKMDGPDASGLFTTKLTLRPGRYEYKYVLEGKTWRHDPANPYQAGYFHNSVLFVPGKATAAK